MMVTTAKIIWRVIVGISTASLLYQTWQDIAESFIDQKYKYDEQNSQPVEIVINPNQNVNKEQKVNIATHNDNVTTDISRQMNQQDQRQKKTNQFNNATNSSDSSFYYRKKSIGTRPYRTSKEFIW